MKVSSALWTATLSSALESVYRLFLIENTAFDRNNYAPDMNPGGEGL